MKSKHHIPCASLLASILVSGLFAAGDDEESVMRRNAAEQGAVLNQQIGVTAAPADHTKPTTADAKLERERLALGERMAADIQAGRPQYRTTHPDAQWFGTAPMGLFLHWGIPSVNGEFDLSWAMIANMGSGKKITPSDYWKLAEGFKAENYNPDHWLGAAKTAGFSYAVLTVKHHDGFTLWPTETTELGVRTSLPGRDLVKEYVEACRRQGIKVGLFFSGVDWYFDQKYRSFNYRSEGGKGSSSLPPIPGRPEFDINHQPVTVPEMTEEFKRSYRDYNRKQITELLTRYGKIDIMWFDGGSGTDMKVEEIRALQPGIIINNRGNLTDQDQKTWPGDYFTWEHGDASVRPPGWWEQLRIWNSPYWGYTKGNEIKYSVTANILNLLARTKAWGGAFLINVGPRPDGTLPPPFYRGIEELGAWMKIHREAVLEVDAVPTDVVATCPVTVRGSTWYLHATAGTPNEMVITPGAHFQQVISAQVMSSGQAVPFTWDGATLRLTCKIPDKNTPHDVIKVEVR